MNRTVFVLIDEIYAMAHVLSLLFDQVENTGIRVNPHAGARLGKMISTNALRLNERIPGKDQSP